MAYTADMVRVAVRGTVGSFEAWSNTWSFLDISGTSSADRNQLAADINNFYGDPTNVLPYLGTAWHAVGATLTELVDGSTIELPWTTATGTSAVDLLPTQLGVRISLSSGHHRGGPFLCGFTEVANGATGLLTTTAQNDLVDALELFAGTLTGHDWSLALDRPTVSTVVDVFGAKIGQRFDVIRKRANDTAEAYATASI